jgi:hypothetical protein
MTEDKQQPTPAEETQHPTAQIVAFPRVQTEVTDDTIKDLRERGVITSDAEEIELDSVAGLEVIGELTLQERVLFNEVSMLEHGMEDWNRELHARVAEGIGRATRRADRPESIMREFYENERVFNDTEEAEEYFFEAMRLDYLKNMLWYSVRSRLQTFAWKLGVRAGYTVVRLAPKFKQ